METAAPPAIAADSPWRLCVAPMMDWTDRHCRAFHRVLAPHARLYTEMVHAQALLHGDRARLLAHDAGEHPLALQLGGSEPRELAAAAAIGAAAGCDEINLNVGCPSDRVQAGRFGACLMREPALVADGVRAMRDAVAVPVTVKCRIGVDEQDAYADLQHFATAMVAAGVEALIVHARKAWLSGLSPQENRELPPLDYARVYRLQRDFPGLTLVINGGIVSVAAVREHLTQMHGVMLGRVAYHDPWVLAQTDAALWGTLLPARADALRALRPYVEAELARGTALRHMARHWLGLYQGLPGARSFRRLLGEQGRAAGADWGLVERALAAVEAAPAVAA
ncbi:MAG TPA: tRNA dihydrouridine(20/20a) synthase DusA [Rhodanobacteraceae bacterium]|nr:tRNA dihydrouridine(20/20a) synthase DusA [Rhodanobacteraceae bacterium]